MALIAVAAVVSYAAVRLSRPYPTLTMFNGDCIVVWSDGTSSSYRSLDELPHRGSRYWGPLVRVEWKDRSSSLHWRYTPKTPRAASDPRPPLRIPAMNRITF